MQIRILMIFLVVGILVACERSGDLSELDHMLADYRFEIKVIYYGGIVGESSATYSFSSYKDSMDVYMIDRSIWPPEKQKIRISGTEYQQLIDNLFCMSKAHQEKPATRKGCSPPWDREYFIEKGMASIRIFPSDTIDCSIEDIIFPYLTRGQEIDL